MAPVDKKAESEAAPDTSLRVHLRSATMAAHDLLDHAMQAASGWQTRSDYARFLSLQYAARVPIERWLAIHATADLAPPTQTPLLARDLAALGMPLPPPAMALPSSRPAVGETLGTAWVLAGSALGNRSIAKQVARISDGQWATTFLDDGAMMAFWQNLRARIERPAGAAEAAGATRAAAAVFAHFLNVAGGAQSLRTSAESLPG